MQQKFLVVSYDDDQQQWFWDSVVSSSAENAAAVVCKDRPYVIAADAISYTELVKTTGKIDKLSFGEIAANYKRTIKEA